MLSADCLAHSDRVRHGFFTRAGGVSEGIYASLNCGLGSGDDPAKVQANRARAMAGLDLDPSSLTTAYQVHSADVAVVESPWSADDRPQVDALVCNTPGVPLGILTADCAPVLFADIQAGVIGAAHAGWRGAKDGVLEATLAAMIRLGARPQDTTAAIGPCIGPGSYEVGAEFRARFIAERADDTDLFRPSSRADHYLFDLPGYIGRRLDALALAAVESLPFDTFADADRFFSYRRVTLNGGGDYGRLLSAIALAP